MQLDQVRSQDWNRLIPEGNPFVCHEFLNGLEKTGSLLATSGWQPVHQGIRHGGILQAACPLYIKDNSHGEFVFDWSWADAYQRNNFRYYPKLLCASPYSPVPGPRLLATDENLQRELADLTLEQAKQLDASSIHWNFIPEPEAELLDDHISGLLSRFQWQFHWHNQNYADFDGFLAALKSKKRKNIRQERARVAKSGVKLRRASGDELSHKDLDFIFRMYQSTFLKKGNHPALTRSFFSRLAKDLGEKFVAVIAGYDSEDIAAAVFLRSQTTLYGRYWGSAFDVPGLHFEACYYQGIEHCIEHKLQRFEPGAQGEHKIARGFIPVKTHSRHWIAHPEFRAAIARHLEQENAWTEEYGKELHAMSPYTS